MPTGIGGAEVGRFGSRERWDAAGDENHAHHYEGQDTLLHWLFLPKFVYISQLAGVLLATQSDPQAM
jgi:hypothetical protein